MSDLRKAAQDLITEWDGPTRVGTWYPLMEALRKALATCPDCGKQTPEGSVHTCSPQKTDPMQHIHAFGREQDSLEDAKQRLLEIMRRNGLATGHGDTLKQVIDTLEVELTDTLAAARGGK